jgi:hypothetical protein
VLGVVLRRRSRSTRWNRDRTFAIARVGIARAAELARAGFAADWLVPLWHLAVQPIADLAQGATEILLDTTGADFRVAGFAAIAVDGHNAVLAEVAAVEADRVLQAEPLGPQLPAPSIAAARITVAPVYNHFNQERSLYSLRGFKLNRTADLSEWR